MMIIIYKGLDIALLDARRRGGGCDRGDAEAATFQLSHPSPIKCKRLEKD